ncbi:DNA topoisomerase 3 [uncultured Clostridium sp.]|nr:DNA topoisomerase 3 [uncultured Clostridium sp.]
MILVIAEKPVLGKAIADALPGTAAMKNGCIYKDDYIVTWVFGHMLSLKEPEDYDIGYKSWNINSLPIFFKDWQVKIGKDGNLNKGQISKSQRVNQIGNLLKQADEVIHAGDPDDEGQLLIDELLRWFNYKGIVKRLDTANTTLVAMKKALSHMTDNKPHEPYGWSAYARSVADLMVGINMSRLFSCKNQTLLTIGRVQTPTLGLVVNRDLAIEGHHKQKYYTIGCDINFNNDTVQADFIPAKTDSNLVDGHILNKEYAEQICNRLKGQVLKNINITKKIVYEAPPLPFNLVKLQTYCSGKFGYSPQQVLDITQSLRENHKAITYNRSDCQYLSEEHYKEAPVTMKAVIMNIRYKPKSLDMNLKSKCFDSSKISAHFAIIPTNQKVNLDKLSEAEKNVYLAICKYYIAQFMPKAKKEQTNLSIELGNGEAIKAVSTVIIEQGYRSIFNEAEKDKASNLSKIPEGIYSGKITDTDIAEKETKPPSRYTKASLNEDMTCISKYVKDPKIKQLLLSKDEGKEGERGSIGTSATRSGIIESLVKRGFLREDGKKVISTALGRELYRILPDEIKKADMTAEWWAIQEEIQNGTANYNKLIDSVYDTIKHIVANVDNYPVVNSSIIAIKKKGGAVIGKCPRCGGDIVETKTGFCCSNWKEPTNCKFNIWKKSKSPLFAKTTFTAATVKKLLNGQSVKMKKLVSKAGKEFEAEVKMKDDPSSQYGPSFDLIFNKK